MANRQPLTPIPLKATPYRPDHANNISRERQAVSDISAQLSESPSRIERSAAIQRKIPGFLSTGNNPLSLFLLFIVIRIISPGIHTRQKSRSLNDIFHSIEQTIYNHEIVDMLTSVSPYLDTPEQEVIYSIIGMLEAIYILKGIRDGSYQVYRMQQTPVLTQDDDKGLGIIKALKDYIPENSRPAADKAIQMYETLEKISNNYRIYTNNLKLSDMHKPNPIEQMGEIIKMIKPVVPQDQQSRIDKLQKIVQIAQIMDLDEVLKNKGSGFASKDEDIQGEVNNHKNERINVENITKEDNTQQEIGLQKEKNLLPAEQKGEAKDNTEQSLENEGQNQSLEMILRLMKLLSQSSD